MDPAGATAESLVTFPEVSETAGCPTIATTTRLLPSYPGKRRVIKSLLLSCRNPSMGSISSCDVFNMESLALKATLSTTSKPACPDVTY